MKIICVGRNYAEHAKELGNEIPEEPVVFLKPETSILPAKHAFYIPEFSKDIHYETELIIKVCKVGKHISKNHAEMYYNEIGLGIDFTARDLQNDLKQKGLPWEKAKAFDNSAVVGSFFDKNELKLNNINFSLKKNGVEVQNGNSSDMINDFDSLISYVSQYFTLKIGDLIFTGTPKGVGKIEIGDTLEGFLDNHKAFKINIK